MKSKILLGKLKSKFIHRGDKHFDRCVRGMTVKKQNENRLKVVKREILKEVHGSGRDNGTRESEPT